MNKIYVVEGKRDKEALLLLDKTLMVITTNGYNFDDKFIESLVELERDNEIVLILDPDFPGQKIRDRLTSKLSNPKHIYIPKNIAIDSEKNKVGLEHVSLEKLKELLKNEISFTNYKPTLTTHDFIELGLTGKENSQELRNIVTTDFHLPRSNSKRLLEYLNKLGITRKQINEVLNES